MKPDRTLFEKTVRRHLSLLGSPSVSQVEASRGRIHERLRAHHEAAQSWAPPVGAGLRYAWRVGLSLAAAATVIVLAVMPWQGTDWLATVEAADGSRYSLEPNAPLRSNDAGGMMLTLKDGSRVEMRSHSELALERAADGIGIRLRTGALIVNAAKQQDSYLYLHTKDMTVAVVGTIFAVNAEDSGSRVTVIEGEVRVREGTIETRLRSGEQISTSAALAARPVKEEIGWSRHADAIFAAFARGMADTAGPLARLPRAPGALNTQDDKTATAPATGEFEEASIRRCDPDNLPETPAGARGGGANSVQMTPGRLHALCMTVATLIRTAFGYGPMELDFNRGGRMIPMNLGSVYGLGEEDGRRVRGGPDWVRSERYTIEAVTGAGAAPNAEAMGGPMLQRLLERRLQLQAHIEAEQIPAYTLTVARVGLKLKPVASDACQPLQARPGSGLQFGHPTSVLTLPPRPDDVRRGAKPSCGSFGGQRIGQNMVFVAGDVPIEALVQMLAFQLGGVRVLDKTGVTDRFNFFLEFAIDENAPGRSGITPPPPSSDGPRAATIFTALEEQLGLTLEQARAPREFVVIDRVERPSAN